MILLLHKILKQEMYYYYTTIVLCTIILYFCLNGVIHIYIREKQYKSLVFNSISILFYFLTVKKDYTKSRN